MCLCDHNVSVFATDIWLTWHEQTRTLHHDILGGFNHYYSQEDVYFEIGV